MSFKIVKRNKSNVVQKKEQSMIELKISIERP